MRGQLHITRHKKFAPNGTHPNSRFANHPFGVLLTADKRLRFTQIGFGNFFYPRNVGKIRAALNKCTSAHPTSVRVTRTPNLPWSRDAPHL